MRDDDQTPPAGARISRREALRLTLAAGVSATAITFAVVDPAAAALSGVFMHGVASGDPKRDAVILWTRVTKSGASADIPVKWAVAQDAQMTEIVMSGDATAAADRDFTVKVDVGGLEPGRTYFYRFDEAGVASPVGRTRTLPDVGVKRLKFAVVSCSNYELGFFNAYREVARHDNLDAVLHLGDYIYEYGPGQDGFTTPAAALGLVTKPRDAKLVPAEEIILLDQYRARHALYKTDPLLQKAHRQNAFINIWDDHEVTNDSWTDGAENHTSKGGAEGDWEARKRAGIRAFYEWLPIREPADGDPLDAKTGNPDDLYRVFDFGDLARLIMIDTRLAGRDQQLSTERLVGAYLGADPRGPFERDVTNAGKTRTMLGGRQERWFKDQVESSDQIWQLIGNQVLMFYQGAPDIIGTTVLTAEQKTSFTAVVDQLFGAGFGAQLAQLGAAGLPSPLGADAWTGYPTARIRMLKALSKASNPIVLTGDTHNAWTANLRLPTADGGATPVGVEFGGTSISSPGIEQYLLGVPPEAVAAVQVDTSARKSPSDKLVYAEQARRGLMLVDVRPKAVTVDHVFLSTVYEKGYTTETVRFRVDVDAKTVDAVS